MKIERWDAKRWGALSEANLRKKLESEGYIVTKYVYLPGTTFPDHSHATDKKDAVLSGKFEITAQGKSYVLEAGDAISVTAGTVHSAEVKGEEPVISLDATRK